MNDQSKTKAQPADELKEARPNTGGLEKLESERKEVKEANDNLQLLSEVVANMAEGIVLVRTSDGVIVFTNPTFERMFGYEKDELVGNHVSILNAPSGKSPEEVANEIMQGLKHNGTWTGEVKNIKKDGTHFWCHANVSTLHHHKYGQIWVSVSQDITKRKLLEEVSERLHRQNELILDAAGEGIYGLDLNGNTTFANPAAAGMTGWKVDELLGKSMHDILHHSKADGTPYSRDDCPIYAAFHYGAVRHVTDEVFWRKDGTCFAVEYVSTPIRDERGRLVGAVVTFRDITERKRAEEALRATQERLQHLVSSSPAVIYSCKPHGDYGATFISENITAQLGYQPSEFVEESRFWANRIHPEDAPRVFAELSRLSEQGHHSHEYRFLHGDGTYRWMHDDLRLMRDAAGSPLEIVGYWIDITERKQMEEALRESERRWRAFLESVRLIVVGLDVSGNVEYVNPFFLELSGFTQEEVIGKHWFTHFLPRRDSQAVGKAFIEILEKEFHAHYENPIMTKSGVERSIAWFNTRLRDPQGRVIGTLSIGEDMTDRKQAEDSLRESELWLRAIFHSQDDAVFVVTPERTLRDMNNAAQRMLGYSIEEVENLSTEIFHIDRHHYEEFGERIREAFTREEVARFEFTLRRKNGQIFPTEHTVSLLKNDLGEPIGMVSVARDITDRKRAEVALRESSQRVVEAQETERRRIARELHDEIGQGLTGLKLALENAKLSPTDAEDHSLDQVEALVRELMARARDLSFDLRPPMLDDLGLLPALRWHLERYRTQTNIIADFKHRRLEERFAPEVETAAYRIVQEALTNVARHAGTDEVAVRLWVDQGMLNVQVEDQGKGFDLAAVGISGGLTGMRERAMMLGGQVTIESAPGTGTRVSAELPAGSRVVSRTQESV